MDFIDKKIFLKNYNGKLTSGDLIIELESLIRNLKRECGTNMEYPALHKNQIQRLKQIVWILEENRTLYEAK